jgi:hypothetical protein
VVDLELDVEGDEELVS